MQRGSHREYPPSAALFMFPGLLNTALSVFPEKGRSIVQHEALNGSSAFVFVKVSGFVVGTRTKHG